MSGDGKRDDVRVATAPNPDSTQSVLAHGAV